MAVNKIGGDPMLLSKPDTAMMIWVGLTLVGPLMLFPFFILIERRFESSLSIHRKHLNGSSVVRFPSRRRARAKALARELGKPPKSIKPGKTPH